MAPQVSKGRYSINWKQSVHLVPLQYLLVAPLEPKCHYSISQWLHWNHSDTKVSPDFSPPLPSLPVPVSPRFPPVPVPLSHSYISVSPSSPSPFSPLCMSFSLSLSLSLPLTLSLSLRIVNCGLRIVKSEP